MNRLYNIVKRPIVSEKSSLLTETLNTYAFEVDKKARKQEIKEAIEKLFNVEITAVKTMVVHGKYKRTSKAVFKKSNWKKALVTLKEGQNIQFFQGV